MIMPLFIWTTEIRSDYKGELESINSSSEECIFFVDALRHGREVMALKFTYSERISGLVDSEGKILNFSSPLFTHNSSCLLGRNILVVKTMGCFRERLLNVRLSQKGSSNIKYEEPTLQILAEVDETQKWTHRVD